MGHRHLIGTPNTQPDEILRPIFARLYSLVIINQDKNCHQNFAFDYQLYLISKMTKIF